MISRKTVIRRANASNGKAGGLLVAIETDVLGPDGSRHTLPGILPPSDTPPPCKMLGESGEVLEPKEWSERDNR